MSRVYCHCGNDEEGHLEGSGDCGIDAYASEPVSEGVSEAPARERVEEAEAAEGAASSPGSIPGAGFDSHAASALSPEAERLASQDADEALRLARRALVCLRLEVPQDVADSVNELVENAFALLRSPVASTTLPREPSEAALQAACAAHDVRDPDKDCDTEIAKAVYAAYAVDGSPVASPCKLPDGHEGHCAPVASLAPTVIDEVHREIVGRATRNHEAGVMFPGALLQASLMDFANELKRRLAVPSSLAPTSLTDEEHQRCLWLAAHHRGLTGDNVVRSAVPRVAEQQRADAVLLAKVLAWAAEAARPHE